MYPIIYKEQLSKDTYLMRIKAPRIVKSVRPGQFVILIADEHGERIPLTMCDSNTDDVTITIVFQVIGVSTAKLANLNTGDELADFVGPLGRPCEWLDEPIDELKKQKFIFVAGGIGAAPIYPQVKWLFENGIKADVIIGSRNKDLLILVDEMEKVADNVYIATDDGSAGFHGLVTDLLEKLVNEGKRYTHSVVIGPMIMMKFVALLTKKLNIPTVVSLNPIMVDGTGMCGACRVSVGGETFFACVDGPEFDGHKVDFDEAMRRVQMYKPFEKKAYDDYSETHSCSCGRGGHNG